MKADLDDGSASLMRTRSAYRSIVSEWDAKQRSEGEEDFRDQCRHLFTGHLQGDRVMDAGCGPGRDAARFAAAGLRVVAADFVVEFAAAAARKNGLIKGVGMDMTRPCFRDNSFDGIWAFASFLHVPRALSLTTLIHLRRLLSPGGVLFVHHVTSDLGLTGYAVDPLLLTGNCADAFCHSPGELAELIRQAAFEVLEITHLSGRESSPLVRQHGLRAFQVAARTRSR